MARVWNNYPRGLSDADLIQAIDEYAKEINASRVDINKVLQFSPYASLGIAELQSRQSKRVTRVSLGISILSLAVSAAALYVSYQASRSTDDWALKQVGLLDQLDKQQIKNRDLAVELVAAQKQTNDTLGQLLVAQNKLNAVLAANKRFKATPPQSGGAP